MLPQVVTHPTVSHQNPGYLKRGIAKGDLDSMMEEFCARAYQSRAALSLKRQGMSMDYQTKRVLFMEIIQISSC